MDTPGALGPASKKSWLVLPPCGVPSPNSRSHRPVMAIGVPSGWSQLSEVGARGRVKNVDVAGPRHVADQQVVAVRAEVRRSLDDPPGVFQRARAGAVGGEMVGRQQVAVGIEHVHHAAIEVAERLAKVT